MEPNAIAASVGIEIGKRVVPRGIARLWSYLGGRTVLILGMERAGKSSFFDYLRYGILEPESETTKTDSLVTHPTFSIALGRDGALRLQLRRTLDVPGQVGAVEHANLVELKRPHGVIVFLDSARAISSSAKWLEGFCGRLDEICRTNPRVLKKLTTLLVAVNKDDKLTKVESRNRASEIKQCLRDNLASVLGRQRANRIPVLPCICIDNRSGSVLVDAVIRKLAKELAKSNA